ncbi:unnamed protein product [Ostreobium quekettii]|uniref:Uncharacterized protein n=1 Tax=Ostreobium quekettii TaxID=121088 RepID=A0A8S1INJ9_9CHLO|nr:unnamed protein product [Ostreobium quekettii]|eukprot:evm.model.scf_1563.3 EVM.evm.TU.scf_1563.3   scf_1563:24863-29681(-)
MEGHPEERAEGAGPPQRRRLVLNPRNEEKARQLAQTGKSSIFGDAKPREEVLAQRTGMAEADILKQEAEHERLHIRLSPQQISDQREAEEAVAEAKRTLEQATDEEAIRTLRVDLDARQRELNSLLISFEKLAVQKAHAGGGIRPSERQRMAELGGNNEDGGLHRGFGGVARDGRPRGFADYGEPRDSYGQRSPRGGGGRYNDGDAQAHRGGGKYDEYGTNQGSGRGLYDDFGGEDYRGLKGSYDLRDRF